MKFVSFDVETKGLQREYALQPFRALSEQAHLTSYAVCERTQAADVFMSTGLLQPSVDTLRDFLVTAKTNHTRIVCWNSAFDIAWLIALGLREEVFACQWLDAMLLYRHLTIAPDHILDGCPKSYGLKAAVARFFPKHAGYADGVDFEDESPDGLQALHKYNRLDSMFTLMLAIRFWDAMPPDMRRCALIEAACLPMVADTFINGIKVNREAASALDAKLEQDTKVAFVTLKLGNGEVTEKILASPKQLGELMFKQWGLQPTRMTASGRYSTDKDSLQHLALTDPRAKLVRDYREASSNRIKFVGSTLASVQYNGDGCTRPAARVYGTYTGRMTYYSKQGKGKEELQTGIALHQWKRAPEYRELIQAPPGHDLLEFDFAGQEFRWMAVNANDPVMIQMCQPGEDAHTYMGARIAGMEYAMLMELVRLKDEYGGNYRQFGKVANLSCSYRIGPAALRQRAATDYGVIMSETQATAMHATYPLTYKQVPEYWQRAIYFGKMHGYAVTLAGRRVQLLPGMKWTGENKWSLESTSINFPIQGAGADQKYLALAVLKDYLPKVQGKFYYELHDGLFVVVPHRHSDRAVVEIRHLLSNLPYKKAWGVDLPIQFPVDAKRGASWGSLEKVSAG
jgi:DNA polymerase I-like protein with 3'-5' exonuclease and polymerase domains